MAHSKKIGDAGEELVVKYLVENGYSIRKQNFHSRYGEIDIIAEKDQTIAFVEVKMRNKKHAIEGEWYVSTGKQRKIIKTALLYLQGEEIDIQPRFDICRLTYQKTLSDVTLDYLENAFDGSVL